MFKEKAVARECLFSKGLRGDSRGGKKASETEQVPLLLLLLQLSTHPGPYDAPLPVESASTRRRFAKGNG